MQLTKEQIQKLNNFLEGIGIEFLDIRLEMLDHIATEIEQKVTDKSAFFKPNGFQTPFLKYMLSRKTELIKTYNKQEKRLTWFYTKTVLGDVFARLFKKENVLLFSLLSFFILYFGQNYLKTIIIFTFVLVMIIFFYGSYKTSMFLKTYKEVKIVRVYTSMISCFAIIPMNFPNFLNVFYNGNYSYNYLYLVSFIFCYLLNQSLLDRIKKIEHKFQLLA